MTFTVEELVIPQTMDGDLNGDFAAAVEIENVVEALGWGTPDLSYEPAEELPMFHDLFHPKRMLVARVEGTIVGVGLYEIQSEEGSDIAWISALVLPEFRNRGIGTALAGELEKLAVADGREKAVVYQSGRHADGEQIESPTGFGSVPAADADVRFLLGRGYLLEQVERVSRLPLPVDGLEARLEAAAAASGPDYAVRYWEGATPTQWLADMAVLANRMSTDNPTAGLEEPEETWTVERVIAGDERNRTSPRRRVVAAVEHLPSGRLVGFTVLSVPQQAHRSPAQYATLVMREHRGHRLGMLLKVANLAHLARLSPGHPSVTTFNAEENRYMLSVNEAVGFEAIAYEGAWKKMLQAPSAD